MKISLKKQNTFFSFRQSSNLQETYDFLYPPRDEFSFFDIKNYCKAIVAF